MSLDGTSTALSTLTTLTGTDFHGYQVAITGGVEKTAAATDVCKVGGDPQGNGAAGKGVSVCRWGVCCTRDGVVGVFGFLGRALVGLALWADQVLGSIMFQCHEFGRQT